ncbi:two-component system sensor histidine kinase TctE [Planktotalea frisia]|uniref:histidine kinase n=2 Tax=Planktotalea frisia TaxID=696762 RepID=A0A1L9NX27_9RHOB|nr:sensor histidine kinase [Planktotalea frisia]OJI93743.1 sensor protein QseC [Planktotalea frisia]PZX28833.1 two-component system sensor histidine kinase TctE [Planktotalea frisia]
MNWPRMNWLRGSLRLRLSVLILLPLILVSFVAVNWRLNNARSTSEGIFDRNLVMLSLAVSRDVAYSGGDTLSETTSRLFQEVTGGSVFYHVYGPDGSFVTGYSSPPVRPSEIALEPNTPLLFDTRYLGIPARAVSLAERVEIDGIRGLSVVTVWQHLQARQDFAQALALQAVLLALILVLTVAMVVYFGVQIGLRPLQQLEAAIQQRSTADLRPIERHIPAEARGIVQRLNELFGKLTEAQVSKDRLISNAAHQLRNPVAAIHTMAQAVEASKTMKDSRERASELVQETRLAMHITQQMLSLERLKAVEPDLVSTDLNTFLTGIAGRIGPSVLSADVDFELSLAPEQISARIDPTMFGEVLSNLVDNALQHAGPKLTQIKVTLAQNEARACIGVENDGRAITATNARHIFERFAQGSESQGAGLGLSIVHEIVAAHGGDIELTTEPVTRFEIFLDAAD